MGVLIEMERMLVTIGMLRFMVDFNKYGCSKVAVRQKRTATSCSSPSIKPYYHRPKMIGHMSI